MNVRRCLDERGKVGWLAGRYQSRIVLMLSSQYLLSIVTVDMNLPCSTGLSLRAERQT